MAARARTGSLDRWRVLITLLWRRTAPTAANSAPATKTDEGLYGRKQPADNSRSKQDAFAQRKPALLHPRDGSQWDPNLLSTPERLLLVSPHCRGEGEQQRLTIAIDHLPTHAHNSRSDLARQLEGTGVGQIRCNPGT